MTAFLFTAKNDIYLGGDNVVRKGECINVDIRTSCAQPYNVFSNTENRKQVVQQFSSRGGIKLDLNSPLLNSGRWDVKKIPNATFSKALVGEKVDGGIEKFHFPWQETAEVRKIDDVEMKKGCIETVADFYREGLDEKFEEEGLSGRCEICMDFYENIKDHMGIDAELSFKDMPESSLGGFVPGKNKIELNAKMLEDSSCEELLNTLIHESRHAFQERAVLNPESVTVSDKVIAVWKENMDNYIRPQLDFEAYEIQEIEKDANYYADGVMKKGLDKAFYA